MLMTSLAVLTAGSVSSVAGAAVDPGAIDAGVQSTLQSFYAQNPRDRELMRGRLCGSQRAPDCSTPA